ncbi:MAG: 30S ribosomal protein S8 [Candidatus Diapherotrites archaeon]|nr:30S ribosomal protein S8 [Candidatus Diapherotrites archaeon]
MSLNDTLANAMICIKNSESVGHTQCVIRTGSKLIREVLKIMQTSNFIGDFEEISGTRGTQFRVSLTGRINDCKAIKPRFPVKRTQYTEYEKQFLPAREMGLIIVSTPEGVMSLDAAKEKKIGGRLLAFVY